VELYQAAREKYQKHPQAAQQLVQGLSAKPPDAAEAVEWAAWTVVANVLLNLDETLCKN
jgi:hypothetical protein